MNTKKIITVAAASAAAALSLAAAPSASAAQPADAGTRAVDCTTFVHAIDKDLGIAACTNNTNQTIAFRAEVVCGTAPDVSGNWVTLAPGEYGESRGKCAIFSSGVGSVSYSIG